MKVAAATTESVSIHIEYSINLKFSELQIRGGYSIFLSSQ